MVLIEEIITTEVAAALHVMASLGAIPSIRTT